MLQSVRQLYETPIGAKDGEIGHVKDVYFDDQNWVVRYVVVDTGSWLPGRKVLLAPHAFGRLRRVGKRLMVHLNRKQVEQSPPIESDQPVSRRYEEEYYRHYGWPYYWQGSALWGLSGFPILELPATPLPGRPAPANGGSLDPAETHLRSTRDVGGYRLQATDGMIGHVCDFAVDPQSWAVDQLVIKTGHRFSGKEVEVPTSQVIRISWDESTVLISLTKDAVEQRPGLATVETAH